MSAAGRERQGLRLRTRWSIGVRLSDLEPMTTLVAFTLASWANQDGLGARPSFLSIAKGCRVDRRTVVTHIRRLEDDGWVRRRSGRGVPNRYSLLIPAEMEAKIEAQLGEWTSDPSEEVGNPHSPVGGVVGNPSALGRESDDTKWGTPVPPSLTEPDKEQPTSEINPLRGSPTQGTPGESGDAPWKGYQGGWPTWLEDQRRNEEEEASEAREEEAI
jgi:DNA-binding MarR family transcriptional regulator